jgi:uncharacterized protein involved in exopolysaccharide biosynthesis
MAQPEKLDKQTEEASPGFSLLDALPHIWAKRKHIVIFVSAVTILSAVIVLLVPNLYTAETSILPELEKNKLLGMAGVSDLAAVTGLSIGETPVSKLYPMIIKSARILREVLYSEYKTDAFQDTVDLIRFWRIEKRTEAENFEAAMKLLRDRMDVSFDNRLGTLVLKVELEEPRLAADVANRITSELDLYTRTKRRTSVTLQREFIEQRMVEVDQALRVAENSLKAFREKNRRIIDSPQLLMEQGRLERDVQINSTVFVELKKQIEIAKIEEIKNIPIINVLDVARIPTGKSSPKRTSTVLVTFFLSIAVSSAVAGYVGNLRNIYSRIQSSLGKVTVA